MLDTLKFMFGILKDQFKKGCEEYIDAVLFTKPVDLSEVSGGYSDGTTIRVIGPIVTRY